MVVFIVASTITDVTEDVVRAKKKTETPSEYRPQLLHLVFRLVSLHCSTHRHTQNVAIPVARSSTTINQVHQQLLVGIL